MANKNFLKAVNRIAAQADDETPQDENYVEPEDSEEGDLNNLKDLSPSNGADEEKKVDIKKEEEPVDTATSHQEIKNDEKEAPDDDEMELISKINKRIDLDSGFEAPEKPKEPEKEPEDDEDQLDLKSMASDIEQELEKINPQDSNIYSRKEEKEEEEPQDDQSSGKRRGRGRPPVVKEEEKPKKEEVKSQVKYEEPEQKPVNKNSSNDLDLSMEILDFVCVKTIKNLSEIYESKMYTKEYTEKLFDDFLNKKIEINNVFFKALIQEVQENGFKDDYLSEELTEKVINYIVNR